MWETRNGWLIKTPTKSFAVCAATAKSDWANPINKRVTDLLSRIGEQAAFGSWLWGSSMRVLSESKIHTSSSSSPLPPTLLCCLRALLWKELSSSQPVLQACVDWWLLLWPAFYWGHGHVPAYWTGLLQSVIEVSFKWCIRWWWQWRQQGLRTFWNI